jgi:hypothetical protein
MHCALSTFNRFQVASRIVRIDAGDTARILEVTPATDATAAQPSTESSAIAV